MALLDTRSTDPVTQAHKVLGLIVLAMAALQLLGGGLRPDASSSRGARLRAWWGRAHVLLGRLTILASWAALYLGVFVYHSNGGGEGGASASPDLGVWLGPIVGVMCLLVGVDLALTMVRPRSEDYVRQASPRTPHSMIAVAPAPPPRHSKGGGKKDEDNGEGSDQQQHALRQHGHRRGRHLHEQYQQYGHEQYDQHQMLQQQMLMDTAFADKAFAEALESVLAVEIGTRLAAAGVKGYQMLHKPPAAAAPAPAAAAVVHPNWPLDGASSSASGRGSGSGTEGGSASGRGGGSGSGTEGGSSGSSGGAAGGTRKQRAGFGRGSGVTGLSLLHGGSGTLQLSAFQQQQGPAVRHSSVQGEGPGGGVGADAAGAAAQSTPALLQLPRQSSSAGGWIRGGAEGGTGAATPPDPGPSRSVPSIAASSPPLQRLSVAPGKGPPPLTPKAREAEAGPGQAADQAGGGTGRPAASPPGSAGPDSLCALLVSAK